MAEVTTFAQLTNEELREELNKKGTSYGPIIPSTRKVYEKKLQNMLEGGGNNSMLDSATENGNGFIMNGNGNTTTNGTGRSPSRETSPSVDVSKLKEKSPSPRNEVSSKPITTTGDQDSDKEEETSEAARVLTPDEVLYYRNDLLRRASSGTNGNDIRSRRSVSIQPQDDRARSNAINNIPAVPGKFKRYRYPLLALVVLAAIIAVTIIYTNEMTTLYIAFWQKYQQHTKAATPEVMAEVNNIDNTGGRIKDDP